jgi:chemotaxis protein methyltransferase CheR
MEDNRASDLAGSMEGCRMSGAEFRDLCTLIKKRSGINLGQGKESLVQARLGKRVRKLGLSGFRAYLTFLESREGLEEFPRLLDAISTNVTSFFRQPDHFTYLQQEILPVLTSQPAASKRVRIWSAGCSSGQEPYSVGIQLCEGLPKIAGWDVKILATDISGEILERARTGVYSEKDLNGISPQILSRYFTRRKSADGEKSFEICGPVRQLVTFRPLNLMGPWPLDGPFDVILCRNVMIYFDRPTQERLVARFRELLSPRGALLIGSSESLMGISNGYRMVAPATYAAA